MLAIGKFPIARSYIVTLLMDKLIAAIKKVSSHGRSLKIESCPYIDKLGYATYCSLSM